MNALPLFFAFMVGMAVLVGFVGLWRLGSAPDPMDARLAQYGGMPEAAASANGAAGRRRWRGVERLVTGLGLGDRIAASLLRADVQLTVAEFSLVMLAAAVGGGLLGWLRGGLAVGALLAGLGLLLPSFYLNHRAGRRRQAFITQLPDVLTLLVGALRAGYGVSQAIDMLVDRLPKPASVEFARVMRSVGLGQPLQRALSDMADRVGSDDLYLVVTAMGVQQELGGNLAQILETITETVRERIRIKREIVVFTSQQRMTGYLLSFMPVAVGGIISLINPGYLDPFLTDPMMRIVAVGAVLMQVLGFLVIRRIVAIEV